MNRVFAAALFAVLLALPFTSAHAAERANPTASASKALPIPTPSACCR